MERQESQLIIVVIVTHIHTQLSGVFACVVLGFTSPFRTLIDSGGIVPISQSVEKWKTCYDTHSILQHFHENSLSQSFWGKHSCDSASRADHSQVVGPGAWGLSAGQLNNYLFFNCLIFLYFELSNYLMLSVSGKFTRLVSISFRLLWKLWHFPWTCLFPETSLSVVLGPKARQTWSCT